MIDHRIHLIEIFVGKARQRRQILRSQIDRRLLQRPCDRHAADRCTGRRDGLKVIRIRRPRARGEPAIHPELLEAPFPAAGHFRLPESAGHWAEARDLPPTRKLHPRARGRRENHGLPRPPAILRFQHQRSHQRVLALRDHHSHRPLQCGRRACFPQRIAGAGQRGKGTVGLRGVWLLELTGPRVAAGW